MTTIDRLFDGITDEPEPPPALVADRSTLERYALCPHQGYLIERGAVSTGSELTDVGNEVHAILSAAAKARHMDAASPRDLREMITDAAAKSRPDIQPDVIDALRNPWPFVRLLTEHDSGERSPEDILRYDGGEGKHSGQLATDLIVGEQTVRVTAEMDLLMATASRSELDLIDHKSGWKHWTPTSVRPSFQFQLYPWLVMRTFPEVNRVNVSIYLSRFGDFTSPVSVDRREMYAIEKRIESAARLYLKFHAAAGPEDVDAYPSPAKCSTCDAAGACLRANLQARELATDPEGYLRDYAASVARVEQMKANLTTAVRVKGKDFNFGDVAFGMEKPVTRRAPACDLYEPKGGR